MSSRVKHVRVTEHAINKGRFGAKRTLYSDEEIRQICLNSNYVVLGNKRNTEFRLVWDYRLEIPVVFMVKFRSRVSEVVVSVWLTTFSSLPFAINEKQLEDCKKLAPVQSLEESL